MSDTPPEPKLPTAEHTLDHSRDRLDAQGQPLAIDKGSMERWSEWLRVGAIPETEETRR